MSRPPPPEASLALTSRAWVPAPSSAANQYLRVVSYNILAPDFTIDGFTYCPPQYLNESYRVPLILAEIEYLRPDIACMQEVDQSVYEDWMKKPMQALGFDSIYTMAPRERERVGVATFFRKAVLTRLRVVPLYIKKLAQDTTLTVGIRGSAPPPLPRRQRTIMVQSATNPGFTSPIMTSTPAGGIISTIDVPTPFGSNGAGIGSGLSSGVGGGSMSGAASASDPASINPLLSQAGSALGSGTAAAAAGTAVRSSNSSNALSSTIDHTSSGLNGTAGSSSSSSGAYSKSSSAATLSGAAKSATSTSFPGSTTPGSAVSVSSTSASLSSNQQPAVTVTLAAQTRPSSSSVGTISSSTLSSTMSSYKASAGGPTSTIGTPGSATPSRYGSGPGTTPSGMMMMNGIAAGMTPSASASSSSALAANGYGFSQYYGTSSAVPGGTGGVGSATPYTAIDPTVPTDHPYPRDYFPDDSEVVCMTEDGPWTAGDIRRHYEAWHMIDTSHHTGHALVVQCRVAVNADASVPDVFQPSEDVTAAPHASTTTAAGSASTSHGTTMDLSSRHSSSGPFGSMDGHSFGMPHSTGTAPLFSEAAAASASAGAGMPVWRVPATPVRTPPSASTSYGRPEYNTRVGGRHRRGRGAGGNLGDGSGGHGFGGHGGSGGEDIATVTLVITNFHAYWNPRYPEVKTLQLALITRKIAAIGEQVSSTTQDPLGFILAGDLNAMPMVKESNAYDSLPVGVREFPTGVYELLQTGRLSITHPHHPVQRWITYRNAGSTGRQAMTLHPITCMPLEMPLRWVSTYMDATGKEPRWTNWHTHEFKETLDYIWLATHTRELMPPPGERKHAHIVKILPVLPAPLLDTGDNSTDNSGGSPVPDSATLQAAGATFDPAYKSAPPFWASAVSSAGLSSSSGVVSSATAPIGSGSSGSPAVASGTTRVWPSVGTGGGMTAAAASPSSRGTYAAVSAGASYQPPPVISSSSASTLSGTQTSASSNSYYPVSTTGNTGPSGSAAVAPSGRPDRSTAPASSPPSSSRTIPVAAATGYPGSAPVSTAPSNAWSIAGRSHLPSTASVGSSHPPIAAGGSSSASTLPTAAASSSTTTPAGTAGTLRSYAPQQQQQQQPLSAPPPTASASIYGSLPIAPASSMTSSIPSSSSSSSLASTAAAAAAAAAASAVAPSAASLTEKYAVRCRPWYPTRLRLSAVSALDVPMDEKVFQYEGARGGGCPNAGCPSDHIPIAGLVKIELYYPREADAAIDHQVSSVSSSSAGSSSSSSNSGAAGSASSTAAAGSTSGASASGSAASSHHPHHPSHPSHHSQQQQYQHQQYRGTTSGGSSI